MKMTYCKIISAFLVGVLVLSGCKKEEKIVLKTGDLLFRGKTPSGLSGAIDEVTQTDGTTHFTHMGLVQVLNDEVYVIHADALKGVCIEPLDSFLRHDGEQLLYTEAYRLKPVFSSSVDNAVSRARSAIGEPYNYSYIIGDSGYYCSELIWMAFKEDSVFCLNPMTFKDTANRFHPDWVEYYDDLDIEIPEGLPGCNPNGMAASENIYKLGVVE